MSLRKKTYEEKLIPIKIHCDNGESINAYIEENDSFLISKKFRKNKKLSVNASHQDHTTQNIVVESYSEEENTQDIDNDKYSYTANGTNFVDTTDEKQINTTYSESQHIETQPIAIHHITTTADPTYTAKTNGASPIEIPYINDNAIPADMFHSDLERKYFFKVLPYKGLQWIRTRRNYISATSISIYAFLFTLLYGFIYSMSCWFPGFEATSAVSRDMLGVILFISVATIGVFVGIDLFKNFAYSSAARKFIQYFPLGVSTNKVSTTTYSYRPEHFIQEIVLYCIGVCIIILSMHSISTLSHVFSGRTVLFFFIAMMWFLLLSAGNSFMFSSILSAFYMFSNNYHEKHPDSLITIRRLFPILLFIIISLTLVLGTILFYLGWSTSGMPLSSEISDLGSAIFASGDGMIYRT